MPPRPVPAPVTRTARACAGVSRMIRSCSDESRYAARTSVRNSSRDASAATAIATATWSLSSAETGSVASLPLTIGSRPRRCGLPQQLAQVAHRPGRRQVTARDEDLAHLHPDGGGQLPVQRHQRGLADRAGSAVPSLSSPTVGA